MEDELDALTREYERQAQCDLERVLQKTEKKLSTKEKTERALARKIPEENKYSLHQLYISLSLNFTSFKGISVVAEDGFH